jgi:hypothetical protein
MHSTIVNDNKFSCSSRKKVARHLCREAMRAGFILSGVTNGGGPNEACALAQLDFMELRDDKLVLEFRRPSGLKIESVEISSDQGQGGGFITYLGSGKAFSEVIVGVKSYARHSEMQNSYIKAF